MSVRSRSRTVRLIGTSLLVMAGFGSLTVQAQEATPVPGGYTVVASGLTNPRGMTWGPDGTLYVALAGSGGTNPATETAPTTAAIGPFFGGSTGAVAQIGTDGCPVLVAGGLPSTADSIGSVLGVEDVAMLGGQLYAGVDGGGPVHGNPDAPSGVYRIHEDGTSELVADLSTWVRENPVAAIPADSDPDAAGYSLLADEAAGLLWVVDPNSGQILSVSPDGVVTRIADLSEGHHVPTRMAAAPQGGIYVGTLTAVPFPDGSAKVMHVSADGTVEDVWTGLTAVTDVAVGPDGALYALEMSTGNLSEPPFLMPGSGRVVKQTGPDQYEVVAEGLMFPVSLEVGPDAAMYVSMPALGANGGEGMIVRLPGGDDSAMAQGGAAGGMCAPLPETLTATPAGATPEGA